MIRAISLAAVCLMLLPATVAVAQKKAITNKIARAARKSYEEAIAKSKKEYAAKLDIAIKEAGGAGDIDEAKRIVEEKKRIGSELDPIESATKRLVGTRWGAKPSSTHKFLANRRMIFAGGYPGVWMMSDPRTMIVQSSKSSTITVWKFNEKLTAAQYYSFTKSGNGVDIRKIR